MANHGEALVSQQRDLPSAGDAIASNCEIIEIRVGELRQLFNAIDPSPFHERDLDPRAEEFIIGWTSDLPADVPLGLMVYLDRAQGKQDEASVLRDAIHEHFGRRAAATRRSLRDLFRRGRTSLLIGLAFLGMSILVGDAVANYFQGSGLAGILRESLLIGGWVAMWGPLEIFLYGWWPIRADVRLFDRLSAMPVRIVYSTGASPDAWRSDWPAVPANIGLVSRERGASPAAEPAGSKTILDTRQARPGTSAKND
ncbi:MAG TPA: hypothetical protein VH701_10845 [Vicinamibacterales bacterium]|jgi:hypothetical protein